MSANCVQSVKTSTKSVYILLRAIPEKEQKGGGGANFTPTQNDFQFKKMSRTIYTVKKHGNA